MGLHSQIWVRLSNGSGKGLVSCKPRNFATAPGFQRPAQLDGLFGELGKCLAGESAGHERGPLLIDLFLREQVLDHVIFLQCIDELQDPVDFGRAEVRILSKRLNDGLTNVDLLLLERPHICPP